MFFIKALIVLLGILWIYKIIIFYKKREIYERKNNFDINDPELKGLIKLIYQSLVIYSIIILLGLVIKFNQ